jgi:hypothetical protein
VLRGVVVLRVSESGGFAPAAVWPEGVEGNPKLAQVVERTLAEKAVVVQGAKKGARRQDPVLISHPIVVDEQLYGAVAIEIEGRTESALADSRAAAWAGAWAGSKRWRGARLSPARRGSSRCWS